MIGFLARGLFLVFGIACLADSWLPDIVETSRVTERHTSESTSAPGDPSEPPTYVGRLDGDQIESCDVSRPAYNALKNGDTVEVRATRILKSCKQVSRGSEVLKVTGTQGKILAVAGGLILVAFGVGLIKGKSQDNAEG